MSGEPRSLTLRPAGPGSGVVFATPDGEVRADLSLVVESAGRTVCLGQQAAKVLSVEHLLAALRGMAIDNVLAELDGDEPPYGTAVSAESFTRLIGGCGRVEQSERLDYVVVPRDFELASEASRAESAPARAGARGLSLEVDICFDEPIGNQTARASIGSPADFAQHLATARSFLRSPHDKVWADGRTSWELTASDLRGIPLVGAGGILTYGEDGSWTDPPYVETEAALHKIVDVIGDLALMRRPVAGGLRITRPGHAFNRQLAARLLVAAA